MYLPIIVLGGVVRGTETSTLGATCQALCTVLRPVVSNLMVADGYGVSWKAVTQQT